MSCTRRLAMFLGLGALLRPKAFIPDAPPNRVYYALKGERITCENGHVICEFARDVKIGQIQDVKVQLTNWQQKEPVIGTLPAKIGCEICGAEWTKGILYHIENDWRDPLNFLKA